MIINPPILLLLTFLTFSSLSLSLPLPSPVVLLISADGFRYGYQHKSPLPNLSRLISNGTEAHPGLIPVFPTLTFPNHYSIATGLYPPYHGIIHNQFLDPLTGRLFTMSSHDPRFWLGEPIWQTVSDQGLRASTFFWPGSEVHKGSWTCPPHYCRPYDDSVPFEDRVDAILSYLDLPADQIPVLMTLYFEDPDHQGHQYGPDHPAVTSAVQRIDQMVGRLISGLEERGVFEEVSIIFLGDHGMVGNCDSKLVFLEDLARWIHVEGEWVQSLSPLLSIWPPEGVSAREVAERMNQGLRSGEVRNGEHLRVFVKEDLPARLHYSDSYRIPPVIGLADEGYKVEQRRAGNSSECGGSHGYDNDYFSMRTVFVAHGPQFGRGRKVPSFVNVEIYNVIASILKLKPAPNNGSDSFASSILLPSNRGFL